MGFFDRFAQKKTTPQVSNAETAAGAVRTKLVAARERLELKDVAGAVAIYEEVLATDGDRPDVLVTISGDLGVTGNVKEIVELVAPRYDAERHGPATGINLLQAYLVLRNVEAAQHLLDILFALKRPDLEERLYGFSNAIAELMQSENAPVDAGAAGGGREAAKVNLVSISKPIWFYGLEPLAEQVLAPKESRLRRVGFGQLATPGLANWEEVAGRPEDEIGRLSRAVPLWLAETFQFTPHYAAIAAVGVVEQHYALFPAEWTAENLRQLAETTEGGLDYVFTGAIRQKAGDYELVLRVWEMKKFRERKTFTARWTPATADVELAKLHEQIRVFMEWMPAKGGLKYEPPVSARAWLEMLGASLTLFLGEKNLLPAEQIPAMDEVLARTAEAAAGNEAASLAFLTLRNRSEKLGVAARIEAELAASELIARARGV
mgnify:CR=1 FL=1|jgi:hypothetical protein